ncbi:hypothetical protein HK099_003406 [Clydaea vesicula]|uniref:Very-long-chain 3-oxoacyl-CoA reductase n=1 Tax=Clydaea vesicula TaxID=447962 RepID=A0AAD5U234_9FUNG|nr:hypothetical protein HK099_003406 [Clydaea vesicula]
METLTPLLVLSTIGSLFLLFNVLKLLKIVTFPILNHSKLSKYKTENSYALVTGASEGIGKEFAFQLAKKGFNLIISARTLEKLETIKKEIELETKVKVIVIPFDFSTTEERNFLEFEKKIENLNLTVLINNVAMNHSIPTPFLEEDEKLVQNIINCNITNTLKVTKIFLNLAKRENRKGLVVNVGSVAGLAPSAYLTVYAASKSFLRSWSIGLAHEVKSQGFHVEHVNTYFVVSNMSKIRKPSFTTPTPRNYVKSVLSQVGNSFSSTPYFSHAVLGYVIGFFSEKFLASTSASMHLNIRNRALRKRERESKNVKKEE